MSTRHRLSKLLLRHGIVYCGGEAWTGKHEQWLRRQQFDTAGLQLAYDTAFDAMLATVDRRDRLDRAITEMAASCPFTPVIDRLQCVRGISTRVRPGRGDRRLAPVHRPNDRRLPGVGAHRVLLGVNTNARPG